MVQVDGRWSPVASRLTTSDRRLTTIHSGTPLAKMAPVTPPRSKLILVVSAVFAVVALLSPSTAESPVVAVAQPGSPPRVLSEVEWKPEPAVTVTHELVRVTEAVSDAPRVRLPSAPAPLVSRKPVQSQKSEGFAARAGRVLLGDGRYRPEPFPRPGR